MLRGINHSHVGAVNGKLRKRFRIFVRRNCVGTAVPTHQNLRLLPVGEREVRHRSFLAALPPVKMHAMLSYAEPFIISITSSSVAARTTLSAGPKTFVPVRSAEASTSHRPCFTRQGRTPSGKLIQWTSWLL